MLGGTKVAELFGTLSLDRSRFDGDVNGANGLFDSLAGAAQRAALGVAAALLGMGVASGKMAIDFQQDMANVHTLLGAGSETERRIAELGEDVKAMSTETGKSLEDLSGGLYQVISAFGDTGDASAILRVAAQASSAGIASTTDAVNLLSAVTKGYGDTSVEAVQKASDLSFLTVKLGQTTFPELAASMGKVVPLGNALGVSMEELYGSMATLTGVTGNTAEVATQMRAVFQSIVAGNPDMVKALEGMGFASGQAAVEQLGLAGTLDALVASTGGSTVKMREMFGSVEAVSAVLALTGPQADAFATKTAAMGDAAGATAEAFGIQQETVGATMGRISASFDVVLVTIGEKFLPALQGALDWVLENMPAIQAAFENAFAAIGAAIGWVVDNVVPPLLDVFNQIITFFQPVINLIAEHAEPVLYALGAAILIAVVPAFVSLAAAVWAALSPFILIGGAIALVVAVLDELGLLGPIVDGAMAILRVGVDLLSQAFSWLMDGILLPLWNNVLAPLAAFLGEVFGKAFNFITTEILPPLVDGFKFLMDGVLLPLWNNVLKPLADFVVSVLKKAFDLLKPAIDLVSDAFDALADVVRWIWDNVLKPVVDFIVGVLVTTFQGLQHVVEVVADVFNDAMHAIGDVVAWVGDSIKGVIDGIVGFFQQLIASAQDVARKVGEFLGNMFQPLLDGINHVINVAKDIWNGFVRFWNGFEIVIPAIMVGDFQITPKLVFGLPDLPHLALGGIMPKTGWALLGERGPELGYLPGGTRVYPAGETSKMLAGGKVGQPGNPLVGQLVVTGQTQEDVEMAISRAARRERLRELMGGAGAVRLATGSAE